MKLTLAVPGLMAALVLASSAGCRKSEPPAPPPGSAAAAPSGLSPDTVARVHWLGKKRLGIEAGAFSFMRTWSMPESARLEAQTLDRLASAPWRLLRGEAQATNLFSFALRPLLNDLVQEESYLELRQPTNRPAEMVLAIRINEVHARRWETNLAAAAQSLTDVLAVPTPDGHGWSLRKPQAPNLIQLTRAGGWTVVAVGHDKNILLGEIVARIGHAGVPFVTPESRAGTNYWLEAEFDPPRIANALGLAGNPSSNLPGENQPAPSPAPPQQEERAGVRRLVQSLPRLSLRFTGDGANVLTYGELTFAEPLQLELGPWNIPINQIQPPVAGFTAIRGIRTGLASWKPWNQLQIGPPPDQLYIWAPDGLPMQVHFATPLPDAASRMQMLAGVLAEKVNPWLAAHATGRFESTPDSAAVVWTGLELISPTVKHIATAGGDILLGGLMATPDMDANPETGYYNPPPLTDLLREMSSRTNLLYYDWEVTGSRIASCLYITQAFRVAFRRPQLPLDSVSAGWLYNVKPRLGNALTEINRTQPNQLALFRKSGTGLTAIELHLLADWLESPQFPQGLRTLQPPLVPAQP
jgi:hypothetical protein